MSHPRPTLAPTTAWEASFRHRLDSLLGIYSEGIGDHRLAELLLAAFTERAAAALAQEGTAPTSAAVRELAARLIAAGVS